MVRSSQSKKKTQSEFSNNSPNFEWKNTHLSESDESSDDSLDFDISLVSRTSKSSKKDSNTRLAEYLNQIEKRRAEIKRLKPNFEHKRRPQPVKKKQDVSLRKGKTEGKENLAPGDLSLSHHYEMLKEQFKSLQKDHKNLKIHHETLKKDRDLLQIEHKNLLAENESLKSESDVSQREELEEEVRKLQAEKNSAEKTKRHLAEAQKKKERELLEIKQQNEEIRRMHDMLKKKYGELTSTLNSRTKNEDSTSPKNLEDTETHENGTREEFLRRLKSEWYFRQVEMWKEDQPYVSEAALARKKQQVKLRWKRMNGEERLNELREISNDV